MVGGDWGNDRAGDADEIHDGVLCVGNCRRSGADASPKVSCESVAVGGGRVVDSDFFAEPDLADQASFHFIAVSAAYPYARCRRGAGGRILEGTIPALRQSFLGATLDRGIDWIFS